MSSGSHWHKNYYSQLPTHLKRKYLPNGEAISMNIIGVALETVSTIIKRVRQVGALKYQGMHLTPPMSRWTTTFKVK